MSSRMAPCTTAASAIPQRLTRWPGSPRRMPQALSVSPVSRSSRPPSGPEFPRTGRASPTVSCCRTAALRRAARPAPSSARRLPRSRRSASPGPAVTTRSASTAIPQARATSRRRFARRSAKQASRPRPWRVEPGRRPRAQARPDAAAGRRSQPGRPPVGIGGRGLADRNSVHVRAHRIVSGAGSRAAIRRSRRRGDHGRHRLAVGLLPRVLVDRPARRMGALVARGDPSFRGGHCPAGRGLAASPRAVCRHDRVARGLVVLDAHALGAQRSSNRAHRLPAMGHPFAHGRGHLLRPRADFGRAAPGTSPGWVAGPIPALWRRARRVCPSHAGRGFCRGRVAGTPAGVVRVRVVLPRPGPAASRRPRTRFWDGDRRGAGGPARITRCGPATGSGVKYEIKELTDLEDLRRLAELFAVVWGRPGEPPMSSDILRALGHSGNYISGAFADGRLIGGLVGWLGGDPRHELHMHSHILGVRPDNEARGLGFGLKQHQRMWCLERGVMVMEGTTDPLVRRNAYFNLTKLGAEAPRYLVDFYGQMRDGINAGDESDRLLIRWRLDSRKAEAAASGETLEPDVGTYRGQPILSVGQDDAPVFTASSSRVLLCETPTDIVALRRAHPALARAWRMAMREALGGALDDGYVITGATRTGWYVLEKQ